MCALINHERKARAKANREKRRDAILEAGRRLFSRQPYGNLTLDIVGRRIGVAKGLASLQPKGGIGPRWPKPARHTIIAL